MKAKRSLFVYAGLRLNGPVDFRQLYHTFVNTEEPETIHLHSSGINATLPTIGNMCYLEFTISGVRYDGEEGTRGVSVSQVEKWELMSSCATGEYYHEHLEFSEAKYE